MEQFSQYNNCIQYQQTLQNLIHQAYSEAQQRGHEMISTEHFLYFIVNHGEQNQEIQNIQQYLDKECKLDKQQLIKELQNCEYFKPQQNNRKKQNQNEIFQSQRLQKVFQILDQQLQQYTIITFILAILIEGTNVSSILLREYSLNDINYVKFAQHFNIDLSNVNKERLQKLDFGYEEFIIQDINLKENANTNIKSSGEKIQLPKLPEINKNMSGPTSYSNYIVPNRVLNGRCPGGYYYETNDSYEEIKELILKGNVDLFVSLIGEVDVKYYRNVMYPKFAEQILKDTGKSVEFILFPIEDFYITTNELQTNFVSILAEKISRGRITYIHCLGGHGRTGTISISLLQNLYGLDHKEATKYVNFYHQARKGCNHYGNEDHMPEVQEQKQQVKELSHIHKRGHKHVGQITK